MPAHHWHAQSDMPTTTLPSVMGKAARVDDEKLLDVGGSSVVDIVEQSEDLVEEVGCLCMCPRGRLNTVYMLLPDLVNSRVYLHAQMVQCG